MTSSDHLEKHEDLGKPADLRTLVGYSRPREYPRTAVLSNLMMEARDGTRLATDVYFPSHDGKPAGGQFPVILDRTPYDKTRRAGFVNDPHFLTERGYVYAFQDCRGHGASEGEFSIFGVGHDGDDGRDAVEWISRQPWCNGEIATAGWSADCITQLALARGDAPESLRAMFLGHGPANYYRELATVNGAPRLTHILNYAFRHAFLDRRVRQDSIIRARLESYYEHVEDLYLVPRERWTRLFEGVPSIQRWLDDVLAHPSFDDYWRQNGYCFEESYDDYPDLPMFFMGAWYDFFIRGTVQNFQELRARQSSPKFLLVTPSVHGPGAARKTWQGDVDFGSDSIVEWNRLRLAFFDEFLRKEVTNLFDESWAATFVMGGGSGKSVDVDPSALPIEIHGRWTAEPAAEDGVRRKIDHGGRWLRSPSWPPADAQVVHYYLRRGSGLDTAAPDTDEGSSSYVFDPASPCPQIGGDWTHRPRFIGSPRGAGNDARADGPGPRDQVSRDNWLGCNDELPLWTRPDVVSFHSPTLEEDAEVAGPISVVAFASSTAVDTDFVFRLIDEYPPTEDHPLGFAMLLREGVVRGRYRNSLEQPENMTPDEIYELSVDLWSIANRFTVGHRIRLDITSSSFPGFEVNLNNGQPPGFATQPVLATNRIHHSDRYPSRLVLHLRRAGS